MEKEILQNAPQYYLYLAWFATILFVVKLAIFQLFGGDGGSEVSTDFTTETETDTSFSFLSLQTVLAFLMGFGWMGYAGAGEFGWSAFTAFAAAFVVGLLFMFGTAYLMFSVKKLEKNVVKDKNTAIGKIGKAYTNFDENGNGKVEIEIAGQLTVADAWNAVDVPINSFDRVKVIGVKDNILHVIKETEE